MPQLADRLVGILRCLKTHMPHREATARLYRITQAAA